MTDIKPIKLLRPEQVKDISDTILKMTTYAFLREEITKEESDAIITYTAQLTALITVLDEQGLIQH